MGIRDTNGIHLYYMTKDKRKNLKVPEELWLKIKAAALKNNRKIIGEIEHRFHEET